MRPEHLGDPLWPRRALEAPRPRQIPGQVRVGELQPLLPHLGAGGLLRQRLEAPVSFYSFIFTWSFRSFEGMIVIRSCMGWIRLRFTANTASNDHIAYVILPGYQE